jgi:hypothetical protein
MWWCMATLSGLLAHAEACEGPRPEEAQDLLALSSEAFVPARRVLLNRLTCLDGPASPELAAALHRVEALHHVLRDDLTAVVEALAAAQALDTVWAFPSRYDTHPLRRLHDEALATLPPGGIPMASVDGFATWIDGHPAAARPVDRPLLFQWVGERTESVYLPANAPLPPAPVEPIDPRKRAPWAALGVAGASLGLGLGAMLSRSSVLGSSPPTCPCPDHERAIRRGARQTNTLAVAGLATGGLAVGLGVRWAL